MTTPATAAGSAPASMGLVARFFGVITSPARYLRGRGRQPEVARHDDRDTLIIAVFTALPLTTEAGKQANIDQQVKSMKGFGFEVTDQVYDSMERARPVAVHHRDQRDRHLADLRGHRGWNPVRSVQCRSWRRSVFQADVRAHRPLRRSFLVVGRVLGRDQLFPRAPSERDQSGCPAADAAGRIVLGNLFG